MAWSLFVLPPAETGAASIKSVHGLVLNIKYSCDFKSPKSETWITLSLTKLDSSSLPIKMSERRLLQQLPGSSIIQAIAMIHVPVDEERNTASIPSGTFASLPAVYVQFYPEIWTTFFLSVTGVS